MFPQTMPIAAAAAPYSGIMDLSGMAPAAVSMGTPFSAMNATGTMAPATTGGLSFGGGWSPSGMTDRMGAWGQGSLPNVETAGGGAGGWFSNGQNLGAVFQGISALTNAYLGFQQLKQAKAGLNFQKDAFKTNLRNSTQTYNTALEDRIRGRTSDYAGKEQDVQSYLSKNSLTGG